MWIAFGIVAAAFFGVTAVGGVVASRVMANRGVRQAKKEYKTAKKELKRVEKLQKRVMEQAEWKILPAAVEQVCSLL
jgi:hypothetical protein